VSETESEVKEGVENVENNEERKGRNTMKAYSGGDYNHERKNVR